MRLTLFFLTPTFLLLTCFFLTSRPVKSQTREVSAFQAHSHNDYLQKEPFGLAFRHGFGSIEADIFLKNDSLFVAHEEGEITSERTLEALYLLPIAKLCEKGSNSAYYTPEQPLQLLIDLKTPHSATLKMLVETLTPYQACWYPAGGVKIVISGDTPPPAQFDDYPEFIFFDGRPEVNYTKIQLNRIALISQSFKKYSGWNGQGKLPREDREVMYQVIEAAHLQNKPFRFWASPDNRNTWETLIELGADFLNTDKIEALSKYISGRDRD
jgi:alkaline phosphatase